MTQASHGIAEFKAVDDGPQGLFAAKVSAFGNVDRNGDRVMPEAFDGTLGRWRASGKNIPVIWSHDHKNPTSYIGWVDPNQIRVTETGIVVAGQLDIADNPVARQAYNLLKNGLVTEWSFAYQVLQEKEGADGAREIYELDLFEVGPTLIGANGETDTLAVASAQSTTTVTTDSGGTTSTVTIAPMTVTTVETEVAESKLNQAVDEAVAALDAELDTLIETKIGRVISRRTEEKIRAAVAHLNELLSSALDEEAVTEGSPSEEKAVEQAAPPSEDELRRQDHRKLGLFLQERGR